MQANGIGASIKQRSDEESRRGSFLNERSNGELCSPAVYFATGRYSYIDGECAFHTGESWEGNVPREEYALGYSFGAPNWGQTFQSLFTSRRKDIQSRAKQSTEDFDRHATSTDADGAPTDLGLTG